MTEASDTKIVRLGVDAHSLERPGWGTHQIVLNLVKHIHRDAELGARCRLYLYFFGGVPASPCLKHPSVALRAPSRFDRGLGYFGAYQLRLALRARRDRVDALFLPGYMQPVASGVRTIVLLTPDLFFGINQADRRIRYRLGYGLFSRLALHRADHLVTLTHAAREALAGMTGLRADRFVVMHPGIDLERFRLETAPPAEVPRPFFLHVGQIFPRRNLSAVIAAVESVRSRHGDVGLAVVGPNKAGPRVAAELRRPWIWHQGYVEDSVLGFLYRRSAALVAASACEGFGMPECEASLLGCPVITLDSPRTREVLGEGACLVADPSELSRAMVLQLAAGRRAASVQTRPPDSALEALLSLAR